MSLLISVVLGVGTVGGLGAAGLALPLSHLRSVDAPLGLKFFEYEITFACSSRPSLAEPTSLR